MRYLLSLALVLPVVIVGFTWSSVAGTSFAAGVNGSGDQQLLTKRPMTFVVKAPPTLAPPVRPTPTPLPPPPTPAPKTATYVVKHPGDELKHIAAEQGVSIFKLIDANKIDDPDNLRVGQVLKISGLVADGECARLGRSTRTSTTSQAQRRPS